MYQERSGQQVWYLDTVGCCCRDSRGAGRHVGLRGPAREEPEAWNPQPRVALMIMLFPKDKQLGLLGLLVT